MGFYMPTPVGRKIPTMGMSVSTAAVPGTQMAARDATLKSKAAHRTKSLAAALAVVGTLGITGCTVQVGNPNTSAPPSTSSNLAQASGSAAVPSIIERFVKSINFRNKSEADGLLCPKITGEGSAQVEKAIADSATLQVDYNTPPKIDQISTQSQTDVGVFGTAGGRNAKGNVVSLSKTDADPCIMFFNIYASS